MPPISRARFAWLLRGLSADEFTSFVADLWAARGWETEVRDGVVVATRSTPTRDRRALLLRHDAPLLGGDGPPRDRGDVTHVVTSGNRSDEARELASASGADLVERDDLYDMALYALDRDTRREVFERYFGRPAADDGRSGTVDEAIALLRTRRGALAALAVLLALAAVSAGGMSLLGGPADGGTAGDGDGPTVSTPTPAPFTVPEPNPTVDAETPTPTVGTPTPNASTVVFDVPPGTDGDDWPAFRGGPARTGHRPGTDGPSGEVAAAAFFSTGAPIVSSPAVVNGTVYVGGVDGRLYALDGRSLRVEWNRSIGDAVVSSPAVVNRTVYVGSLSSITPSDSPDSTYRAHAVEATNGSVLWNARTWSIATSSPAAVNGTVYVGSTDGRLYALDAASGRQRWAAQTNGSVDGSPAVANGAVIVGSLDGHVYAFDAANGTERWTVATNDSVVSSPAIANGTVYVGSVDGRLYALDAANGSIAWRYPTGDAIISSSAVANDTVYVGGVDGDVRAIDATSGRERWNASTNDSIVSSPAVANGTVIVGSLDGRVYAFDARSGDRRWAVDVGASVQSSPAVVDGIVYVGADDGRVYALARRPEE